MKYTCPDYRSSSTQTCIYVHCRGCGKCQGMVGFGAFGYCKLCIEKDEDD